MSATVLSAYRVRAEPYHLGMGARLNIFSGARRLAIVLTVLVSGWLAGSAVHQTVQAFNVEIPEASGTRPPEPREEQTASAAVEPATPPILFDDLIPTRETKLQERDALFASAKDMALGALGFAVSVWVFSAAVGWIVRGLLGIPTGLDHKAE